MGVHFLAHFISRTQTANQRRRGTTGERNTLSRGVHQTRLNVLVVEYQQAIFRAVVDRVEVHAIVVRANLLGLVITGVVNRERREAAQNRRTPGNDHLVAVTLGHHDFIGGADGDSRKAQQVSSRCLTSVIIIVGVAVATSQTQTEEAQRSSAGTALEYLATGQAGLQYAGEQRIHLTGAQWLIPSPVVDIHQLITLFDGHRFLPLQVFWFVVKTRTGWRAKMTARPESHEAFMLVGGHWGDRQMTDAGASASAQRWQSISDGA